MPRCLLASASSAAWFRLRFDSPLSETNAGAFTSSASSPLGFLERFRWLREILVSSASPPLGFLDRPRWSRDALASSASADFGRLVPRRWSRTALGSAVSASCRCFGRSVSFELGSSGGCSLGRDLPWSGDSVAVCLTGLTGCCGATGSPSLVRGGGWT